MRRGARRHGLAGLAALGSIVVAGVVAGWGVTPVETREITPAEVVDLRFPTDWNDDTTGSAPAAPAARYDLASADAQPVDTAFLFSPRPTLSLSASAMTLASAEVSEPMSQPVAALSAQPIADAKAAVRVAARETVPEGRPVAARSPVPAPERHATAPVRKDSGNPLNDAQLASIKRRLNLSPYQQQYWPQVESALRDIGLRAAHDSHAGAAHGNARLASIDPDGPEVARLKSAAFPLIMSMNDEQKQQVRTLAQGMGLERVAASF